MLGKETLHDARILVVDDEEMAADVLCRILEEAGYTTVERVIDPRQAVARFRELKPDLVILDWLMPKLSGASVLKQLRATLAPDHYLPVLVVTALPHAQVKHEALESGATDFLTKPYDRPEILLRVRNLVETRLLYRQLEQERDAVLWSQREETAEALRRSAQEWEQSFDAISDHVCVVDLSGKILRANKSMRERFEPIHGSLFGLDYRTCYCGKADAALDSTCAAVMSGSGPAFWEGRLPALPGWYSVSRYPLTNESGIQWGAVSVVRDSTRRHQAEEALQLAHEQLEQRVRERTDELSIANAALSMESVTRRRAEEELRRSQEKLELAIASADLGTWEWDIASNEVICSPRAETIFGLAPGDGSKLEKMVAAIHREDQPTVLETLRSAVKLRKQYTNDYRVVWPDGSIHWVAARGRVSETDDAGWSTRMSGTVHEITEAKQTEAALRDAESRFRAVIETMPGIVFIKDLNGRFLLMNKRFEEFFGRNAESVIGKTNFEFLPRETATIVTAHDREVIESGRPLDFDEEMPLPAGRRLFRTTKFPLFDGSGNIYAVCGIATDITERQRAEEALRESQARYAAILANVPGMVYRTVRHPDGSVAERFVSDGCRDLLGLEPAAIQHDPDFMYRLVHPDDLPDFIRSWHEALNRTDLWQWEGRVRLATGEEKWVRGAARGERRPNGGSVWDGLLFDITQRKQSEQAALEAREEAERANHAKSEFLSRMSHELRTPLNAILGFGQLLQADARNPEEADNIDQIIKAGRHLLGLIDEVLQISHIDAGRVALSMEPVQVAEAWSEAVGLVRETAKLRGVTIGKCDCDAYVLADKQRLKQVFLNLLSNAIKYTPEDTAGTVTIAAERTGTGNLRLMVHDTGPGIPAEATDKIFQPFERLEAAKSNVEGVGLGLAICKRLVELMGGAIGAESALGQGTTFWVELPLTVAPLERRVPVAAGEADNATSADEQTRTVLYIEDNLSNLRLVERVLAKRPGIKLIAAMQGQLGVDLAREHRPDLILLDIHLPDMNGDDVLKQLLTHSETAAIPVVILSADATAGQIERLKAAGARDYLTKPFNVPQFFALLDRTFGTLSNRSS